jgi:hypothetical protein
MDENGNGMGCEGWMMGDGMGHPGPSPALTCLSLSLVLVPLNSSLRRPALDGCSRAGLAGSWMAGWVGSFITYDQLFFRPPQGRVPVPVTYYLYLGRPLLRELDPKPLRRDKIKTVANICASSVRRPPIHPHAHAHSPFAIYPSSPPTFLS